MANLILTKRCFNQCPFCFVNSKEDLQLMCFEDVRSLWPVLDSFKRDTINVLGGEPTLNTDFLRIVRFLLQQGKRVKIFTNGKLPADLVASLQNLNEGEFDFCVNRTQPQLTGKIIHFYHKLGYRIELSLTVFKSGQPKQHIIEEISTFRLRRKFRLGIALPDGAERQNACLLPQHYAKVSREIFVFIQKAVQASLHPEFDCGFPYCFFDAEQRAFLEASGIEFASNCGVIPDIGPGFFITPCFPLARFSLPVSESHTWPDLQRKLECKLNQRPPEFLFDACESCDHLHENRCCGGCAAFRLNA